MLNLLKFKWNLKIKLYLIKIPINTISVYNTDLSILIYLLNFNYLIISTWSNKPFYPQLKQQTT